MITAFLRRTIGLQRYPNATQMNFSDFFRERDKSEIQLHLYKQTISKRYLSLKNKWKEDLEKKQEKRQRKLMRDSEKSRNEDQDSKFVVHNVLAPLHLPPNPEEIFAVVIIGDKQYKVTQDDLVMVERLKELDINTTIELDKVLMIGTKEYTSLGRPIVNSAKVLATVEEQTRSEKQIIFKKRRRKHYRKSQGHQQHITLLRINKIEHTPAEQELSKAVSLV